MGVKKGDHYSLRIILRPSKEYQGNINVKLLFSNGDMLSFAELGALTPDEWNDVNMELESSEIDSKAKLAIEFNAGFDDGFCKR